MTPDVLTNLLARIEQLESISTCDDCRVSVPLRDVTRHFNSEFAEVLDIAPNPFLVESVDPDAMDTAELTRLQQWLGTAFGHIRKTRKVPRVCIQVATLVASHLRSTLPPISTYDAVMAALKHANDVDTIWTALQRFKSADLKWKEIKKQNFLAGLRTDGVPEDVLSDLLKIKGLKSAQLRLGTLREADPKVFVMILTSCNTILSSSEGKKSIDFSDDARNRAILSHLWEAGHLMVFEGVGDTVVVDPQAFGTQIIGQLFCPHGDSSFKSLVVKKEDSFIFRQGQLETYLKDIGAPDGRRVFGDAQFALQLLNALELVIRLTPADEVTDDPQFAIPGRLNHLAPDCGPTLEPYYTRPQECWTPPSQPTEWVYRGVRMMLGSPLHLIPPSEFPRLQHRLSVMPGFRLWRHGIRVGLGDGAGSIDAEGLIELNDTREYIDVCVRSHNDPDEARCIQLLVELVEACSRMGTSFRCTWLLVESLKKYDDFNRWTASEPALDTPMSPIEWLGSTHFVSSARRTVGDTASAILDTEELFDFAAAGRFMQACWKMISPVPPTEVGDPYDCSHCGTSVDRSDAYVVTADSSVNGEVCVWRAKGAGPPTIFYSIDDSVPADSRDILDVLLKMAAHVWSECAEVRFAAATDENPPHFVVKMGVGTGSFAKAFFPGDYKEAGGSPRELLVFAALFDLKGNDAKSRQVDVLTHELGHILGLLHNGQIKSTRAGAPNPEKLFFSASSMEPDPGSIMYAQVATRPRRVGPTKLSKEDTVGAQVLYGRATVPSGVGSRAEVAVVRPNKPFVVDGKGSPADRIEFF